MPDISMCNNKLCEKRKACYRYMAIPCEYRQCYATFKEPCDYFWPLKKACSPIRTWELPDEEEKAS